MPPGWAAGTTLSILSGETDAPLAGARVVVGGRTYETDARGQAIVAEAAAPGTFVDVISPGFFDRQTVVRSDGITRHALWPRVGTLGLDEAYTATIVYTSGTLNPPAAGSSPLLRLPRGTTEVVIVLSSGVLGDDSSAERHANAVEALNQALHGQVRYVLAPARPPAGVVFESRVDPADSFCQANRVLAYTTYSLSGSEIRGGRLVFCSLDSARSSIVVHEMGHTFGLQHSPNGADAMTIRLPQPSRYSAREELMMKMMLERPAGNRFPDADRTVTGSSAQTLIVVCP